ncbi:MAG: hypothetical protein ACODAE_00915 [Gemmatimonadota bacterium]
MACAHTVRSVEQPAARIARWTISGVATTGRILFAVRLEVRDPSTQFGELCGACRRGRRRIA